MAKRFIDSKIWADNWFQDLDPMAKLVWIYLFTNCDIIGTWEYNPRRAEFEIGKKLSWDELKVSLSEKVQICGSLWVIKRFIAIQYPNLLHKPSAPLHLAVMSELNKKCLNFNGNSLSIDYPYTIDSVTSNGKEKEEVKEKEKEEEREYPIGTLSAEKTTGLHLFKNSPYFDFPAFRAAFPAWDEATCRYWYDEAFDYSASKGARYKDWSAAIRNWHRRRNSDQAARSVPKTVSDESLRAIMETKLE